MISRREVVTAGVLGTLGATGTVEAAQQPDPQTLKEGLAEVEKSIDELKTTMEKCLVGNSMDYGNLGTVKAKCMEYAKTTGRFPEYCDIGLAVFYDVYDWHVRQQQQIQISRIADQRMAIQFMFTQLILRWEQQPTYVGTPFDR